MATYFINLSRRDNDKTVQYKKQGYLPIYNPDQHKSSDDLHRATWSQFFRNPKFSAVIVLFHRWNNHIRDYAIYAVTHGIRFAAVDMTLNTSIQFAPISNLCRNKFADDMLLTFAYDTVWSQRRNNQDRFKKRSEQDPKLYLLKQMKADNLRYFSEQEDTAEFDMQLQQIASTIDKLNMSKVNTMLPYFGFVYEFVERLRQLVEQDNDEWRGHLPYMPRYDEPFQFFCDVQNIPFFRNLSNEVWASTKDFIPLQNKQTLIDFAHTWAGRYELPLPNNDREAMQVGLQLIYYIAESIPPCRDCRLEDLVSYERVAFEIETAEEVALMDV